MILQEHQMKKILVDCENYARQQIRMHVPRVPFDYNADYELEVLKVEHTQAKIEKLCASYAVREDIDGFVRPGQHQSKRIALTLKLLKGESIDTKITKAPALFLSNLFWVALTLLCRISRKSRTQNKIHAWISKKIVWDEIATYTENRLYLPPFPLDETSPEYLQWVTPRLFKVV